MGYRVSLKASIIVVVAALLGVLAASASRHVITSAAAGEPGYTLSGFEIAYPYDDPREAVGPDEGTATLSFVAGWASGDYPGNVPCQVILQDDAGREVGGLSFDLDNATDGSRTIPMTVAVSGQPRSASGTCGEANYGPGPGYVFSDLVSKEASEGRGHVEGTKLTFDVAWEDGPEVDPGMRTCYLRVTRTDGTEDAARRLDINISQDAQAFYVPGKPDSIRTASIDCGPMEE